MAVTHAQHLAGGVLPSLITGVIVGVLQALLAISLGGLIFSGALDPSAGIGIGMGLFAAVVTLLVALGSSLSVAIGSAQDVTAVVLAVVAAGIVTQLGADHPGLVGTVIVAVTVSTALTGASLWLLGRLRLGQVGRYVPYPVVGGFLAGTGWLLLAGGISVAAGDHPPLGDVSTWTDGGFLGQVTPALLFAVALLLGVRRGAGPAFVPLGCVAAMAVFYLVTSIATGTEAVRAAGWLLGPFPSGALWPPDPALLGTVEVSAIVAQAPGIVTVVALAVVALILNASGIELTTNTDGDLDRELRTAGIANLVAACGGGIPGFHALSITNLVHRTGARPRVVAWTAAGFVGLTLLFSGDVVAFLPRPVVGGLLAFLGLAFLVDWIVDGWSRMTRSDYVLVVLIVVVIATVGFLEGVALGIVASVVLFLVAYSRTDVVRHSIHGDVYPSHVERSPGEIALLKEVAGSILVLELQGYLFFGTAQRMLDRLRTRLEFPERPVRHLVLDFRHVTGLDSSTVLSFQKAAQLAVRHDATLVLAGARGRVATQIATAGLADLVGIEVVEDRDEAVEWCEDALLAERRAAGGATTARSLQDWLADGMGDAVLADRLVRCLEQVTAAAGEAVITQGERHRDLYFLVSGVLTVTLVDSGGQAHRLRTMTAGNVVGEVALYLDGPRSASVVADTDVHLLRLPQPVLERLERDDPELAAALHRLLAGQLAARLASTLATVEALRP